MNSKLSVSVAGIKTILSQNDFLGAGGEADLYSKNGVVYKIYQDAKHAIAIDKIQELKSLNKNNVLIPKDQIFDSKSKYIGFTMDYVENTLPLCKLFANSFWTQNSINANIILELTKEMQSTIQFIHDKKCLIVDCNDFNFLVDEKFKIPYFIDVDSYQTPHYPATVIMPSIRDWHAKQFNAESDWFSFGIISCQMFVGIHPYKGTHPKFQKKDLEGRMKSNISVFNKDVSVPANVRNFSHIPGDYKEWFLKIFEKGERLAPPYVTGAFTVVRSSTQVITGSDKFEFKLLKTYGSDITFYKNVFNRDAVFMSDKFLFNHITTNCNKDDHIIFLDEDVWIAVSVKNRLLEFNCNKKKMLNNVFIAVNKKFVSENRLYAISAGKLSEIQFKEINGRIIPNVKNSWDILENATTIYSEFCATDIFGRIHLSIPYYFNNRSSCSILHVKELDGYKILNAKKCKNIIMFIMFKDGIKYKLTVKFNEEFKTYKSQLVEDIDFEDVNFTVLDTGIAISQIEDKAIEIFYSAMSDDRNIVIKDSKLLDNMIISNNGQKVVVYSENKLYEFSIRK